MKTTGMLLIIWCLLGCGGAAARSAPSTADDYASGMNDGAPQPLESRFKMESAVEESTKEVEGDLDMSMEMEAPPPAAPQSAPASSPSPPQTAHPADQPDANTASEPMVIYTGFLRLRVKQLLTAVDEITRIVDEQGGYIDSLTRTVVVVRIPGKDFEAAMETLAAVGDLLNRRVQAQDVTRRFTDLISRRDVAEEARGRLLRLLEAEQEPRERLRILREIKRLSEQIDTIESTLAAIRNLVDYFTITIELVPVLAVERVDTGLSPFAWVRSLKPHLDTLHEGKDDISMSLPKGFVLFDEDDSYRAQAADTSIIRAGKIENEPKGDNRFWSDAVDFEMTSRQETVKEKGEAGALTYRLYENDDVTPRFYLVAVRVTIDDIYVIEVFYPNAEAYERHHKAVLRALETVEVAQ